MSSPKRTTKKAQEEKEEEKEKKLAITRKSSISCPKRSTKKTWREKQGKECSSNEKFFSIICEAKYKKKLKKENEEGKVKILAMTKRSRKVQVKGETKMLAAFDRGSYAFSQAEVVALRNTYHNNA